MVGSPHQVFLSHHSPDKPFVRQIAERLRGEGISVFLDEAELIPGQPWQPEVEKALASSDACAVFIGASSIGPWQEREIRAAISRQVETKGGYPVIPVVLPGARKPDGGSEVPAFLRQNTWVEFHDEPAKDDNAYRLLLCGIRSDKPVFVPPAPARDMLIVPRGLWPFEDEDHPWFLRLVPGKPDDRGLPECLRQWKTQIERTDEDQAFPTIVLWGPCGGGKTSLVRAGLIPALAADVVVPIYIKASANNTEAQLLGKLGQRVSGLPADLALPNAVAYLKQHPETLAGRKVVLLLDQFERWLHARRSDPDNELTAALRQCNGNRIQAVLVVRDQFYGAVGRFLESLGEPTAGGENWFYVAPFDSDHARFVLREFCRARRSPEEAVALAARPNAFLDRVVTELQDSAGNILPVHIAFLAEALKGQPWTKETLDEIGGVSGAGRAYLEDSFDGRSSHPVLRNNRQLAFAVLNSLLPPIGATVDAHSRSVAELRDQAQCDAHGGPFDDVLATLERTSKLITPTDTKTTDGGARYQLAHDFFVPWLREWLDDAGGGAQRHWTSVLRKRAAEWDQWQRYPGSRRRSGRRMDRLCRSVITGVPSRLLLNRREYRRIQRFVPRARQTELQRRLLDESRRHFRWRLGCWVVAATLIVGTACYVVGKDLQISTKPFVEAVLNASPGEFAHAMNRLAEEAAVTPRTSANGPETGVVVGRPLQAQACRHFAIAALKQARGADELPVEARLNAVLLLWEFKCLEDPAMVPAILDLLPSDRRTAFQLVARRFAGTGIADHRVVLATVGLALDRSELAGEMLKLSGDPTHRTAFIVGFSRWHQGVPPPEAWKDADPSFRSGMLCAMARVPWDQIGSTIRDDLHAAVAMLYTDAPDAATHSAALCVLTNWNRPLPDLPTVREPPADCRWFVNGQGITMIRIPAGTFRMGDDKSQNVFEKPAHTVKITHDFFLSDREVTQALFQRFIDKTRDAPAAERVEAWQPNKSVSPTPDCPAHMVSWIDAARFCNWLSQQEGRPLCYQRKGEAGSETWSCDLWAGGYRLPREAEWEYACRAGTATQYSCGNDTYLGEFAWLGSNADSRSWPMGTKQPNAWGLFDMHGNLWEWCGDWHARYPKAEPDVDPSGPVTGSERVVRGGGWDSLGQYCRSVDRLRNLPDVRGANLGFRVAAVRVEPSPR